MRVRALLSSILFLAAGCAAQDSNFASGPQYLLTGSPLLAHSIATPSLSLEAPLPPIEPTTISIPDSATGVAFTTNPLLEHQANLVPIYYGEPNYYGVPNASVVEISFAGGAIESAATLPASIAENGVTQFVDPQVLRVRGYGVPLGEVAAYYKAHKTRARSYSNDDVKRVHPVG